MYPAVNSSEPLDLASYCRYDLDDDHICSINRSPVKMAAIANDKEHRRHYHVTPKDAVAVRDVADPASATLRPNGFVTVAVPEYHVHRDITPSPPLPQGVSTPPPSAQSQPLLAGGGKSYREVNYPGDLSLRFVKPIMKDDAKINDDSNIRGYNANTIGNTNVPATINYTTNTIAGHGRTNGYASDTGHGRSNGYATNTIAGHGRTNNHNMNYNSTGYTTNTIGPHGVYNTYQYQPPPPPGFDNGHTTLPANRKAVLINSGPKSPLGKRSKSVTFSQPVAMVTPLNSESEESMDNNTGILKAPQKSSIDHHQHNSHLPLDKHHRPHHQQPQSIEEEYDEEPNYDNLNEMEIPDHPVMPGKPELIKIPRWEKPFIEEEDIRPMSTFSGPSSPASPSSPSEVKVILTPPPDEDIRDGDGYDDVTFPPPPFWASTKQSGKPVVMPKPQKAKLYETGV